MSEAHGGQDVLSWPLFLKKFVGREEKIVMDEKGKHLLIGGDTNEIYLISADTESFAPGVEYYRYNHQGSSGTGANIK
jgi:hypothetical protein